MAEPMTLDDAIEDWQDHDGWEFADREAAWKWFFERGQAYAAEQLAAERLSSREGWRYADELEQERVRLVAALAAEKLEAPTITERCLYCGADGEGLACAKCKAVQAMAPWKAEGMN